MLRLTNRNTSSLIAGFACVIALATHAQPALAQQAKPTPQQPQQPQPQQPQQQQPEQKEQPQQSEQKDTEPDIDEGKPTPVEGSNLVIEPHMQPEDRPAPPQSEAVTELGEQKQTTVVTGAGVGSDVAYASRGVVELGGNLALTHASDTTTVRIAPSVGYFFIDNLELTLFPDVTIIDVNGESDVTFGATLEPSYHLPATDRIFGFLGVGLGLSYADDPGVDVTLRPRLGMDVMVGRSGILKPAAFLAIGANDGLSSGGFEVGFTVML